MTTIVVLVVAVVCAAIVALVSIDRAVPIDPLDTERQERWFVTHAPRRLQRALRYLDGRVVGGAGVALVLLVVFGAGLMLGWMLDGIDEGDRFARWDKSAAEWGARNATTRSTEVLEWITQLGATGWLVVVMVGVGVADYVRHRHRDVVLYLLVVSLGISLLNNGLKWLVERERPAVSQLTGFGGSSFPSGHAAAAAACWAGIALVVTRHRRRPARAAAAGTAVLIAVGVAASRVLLGVHWLTDVIAGMVVGWTWCFLVTLLFGGRILRLGEPVERLADGRTAPSRADQRELEGAS